MGGEGLCCARRRARDTSGSTPVSWEDLQNSTYALGGETHVRSHISEGKVCGWWVLTSFSTWNSRRKWIWPVHTGGRVTAAVCSTKNCRGGCSSPEKNTGSFVIVHLPFSTETHCETLLSWLQLVQNEARRILTATKTLRANFFSFSVTSLASWTFMNRF